MATWRIADTGFTSVTKLDAGGAGTTSFTNQQSPRANGSAAVKWQVNDKGELCTHMQRPNNTEKCTLVQRADGGTYARILDGKVDSTFKVR